MKKINNRIYGTLVARVAYRLILGRPVDTGALKDWRRKISDDRSWKFALVSSLFVSEEYKDRLRNCAHGADLLLNFIHSERCELVRNLPEARFIVDLGGSAPNNPYGALLGMGYPHEFEQLLIVDLPAGMSVEQSPTVDCYDVVPTASGAIRYVYRNMCEIDAIGLRENSVDLFWMGQSVEHIEARQFETLLASIYKYLKPGGHFCFDTPNRRITAIQSPEAFIHPEHKIEYFYQDLIHKLSQTGFEIVQTIGIGRAEEVICQNQFLPHTIIRNIRMNPFPERSYIFYFDACKP
ncbi:MAG: methyltransferase domain-containing protein [Desulfobacterales bacterium]|nr:MAG: methyltransferase domain-containing protein [Desulfobacterales bacterium]